jgi:hypothetical protein
MHDHPNSAFEKPKKPREGRKKWRIYRVVLEEEFRATESAARKRVDYIRASRENKNSEYWLSEVPPKRAKPIR